MSGILCVRRCHRLLFGGLRGAPWGRGRGSRVKLEDHGGLWFGG